MKITPLEIRQKTFEKGFRGYEKDEVNAYLHSLSLEWERLLDENKDLNIKLKASQAEVTKLREVETSLYKTLKTAEDTGANMVEQANKIAEMHMKETEIKSEAIFSDAKNKARDTIEEAEMMARQTIEEMEHQLTSLKHTYKTLENFRDDLLSDIRTLSTDALERVERMKSQIKRFDIEEQVLKIKRQNKKVVEDRQSVNKSAKDDIEKITEKPKEVSAKKDPAQTKNVQREESSEKRNYERSFFDEIN
ncbi:MAG: DivIVA domain-containing protein [Cyclobacteriaceae bacterium]|nr:DivIVA domain-containing protein [Cyclobacteriaceae bacterium]